MNEIVNEGYIWTLIFHRESGKYFEVTTIDRDSSSPYIPGHIYSETLIWECDPETKKKDHILWQDEDSRGHVDAHLKWCKKLVEKGEKAFEEEEEL